MRDIYILMIDNCLLNILVAKILYTNIKSFTLNAKLFRYFFLYMKINCLKKVFDERKIQNRVLAKYLDKSESTISLWRNNKRQPSLEELYQIAKLLRVNIHDLLEPTSWKGVSSETYDEFSKKLKNK